MKNLNRCKIILLCTLMHLGLNGQHFFKSFDQSSIYYEDLGQGEVVVLLHGFINTSKNWLNGKLPNALVANGFRVVIPDLRGNGLSDKPHSLSAYTDHTEIKDVVALMQHLGIKRYHVVGYSRGAIIAADLMAHHEGNVLSATLGGMGLDFTNPEWPRRKMFAEAFGGKSHLYPETKGAIDWAKKIGADTTCLSLQQYAQPATSQAQLSKLQMPTLVIAGNEDKDNGDPKLLADIIPNAKLTIIDGNHNQSHSTQAFADEVAKFILSVRNKK